MLNRICEEGAEFDHLVGKVSASAMELTADTWDAAVTGKTIFVKFLAPW